MRARDFYNNGKELLQKSFAGVFGGILSHTHKYRQDLRRVCREAQAELDEQQRRYDKRVSTLEATLNTRTAQRDYHAERAATFQQQTVALRPSLIIPRYNALVRRLNRTKQPYILHDSVNGTIMEAAPSVLRNVKDIKSFKRTRYQDLKRSSEWLEGPGHFDGVPVKVGRHVYEETKAKEYHGLTVIHLRSHGHLATVSARLQKVFTEQIWLHLPSSKRADG